jgi:hypothetical protein
MSFKLPLPITLSIGNGGGGGGTSLNTEKSSIVVDGDTNSITIKTNDADALFIDNNQNVGIGISNINILDTDSSTLTINGRNGNCIDLLNNNLKSTISIDNNGGIHLSSYNNILDIENNSLYINNHNGINSGLFLNNQLVLSSAIQLNYNNVIPGVADELKSIILDIDKNISGINNMVCTTLTGSLLTSYQPNITLLDTININTSLSLDSIEVLATANEINYNVVIPGLGNELKSLILDQDRSIENINNLTAETLTGSILTANQPNITSIGTLDYLVVNNYIGIGTSTPSTELEIKSLTGDPSIRLRNSTNLYADIKINESGSLILQPQGDLILLSNNKSLLLQGTGEIRGAHKIISDSFTGILNTPIQSNITELSTLSFLNISGSVGIGTVVPDKKLEIYEIDGNVLRLSRLDYSTDFILNNQGDLTINVSRDLKLNNNSSLRLYSGDITGINNLTATNLTGTLQTANQSNITSLGTLSSLDVLNDINCGSLIATNLTGTLQTANQSNITSLGTLSSLNVLNSINCGSLIATNLTGTLQTANQSNITSLGTLSSLNVSGDIIAANIEVDNITGTLQTANQSNITSLGTLSSLNVLNSINCGSLIATNLTGTLQTANQSNITSLGTLSSLNVSGDIIAANIEVDSITGTLVTSNQSNITSLGTLSSLNVLNSINCGSLIATNLTGTLQTSIQNNIISVGRLNKLSTTGNIGINIINPLFPLEIYNTNNQFINLYDNTNNCSISLDSIGNLYIAPSTNRIILSSSTNLEFSNGGNLVGISEISATSLIGTLITAEQPNITSIGELDTLSITNKLFIGNSFVSNFVLNITSTDGQCIKLIGDTGSVNINVIDGNFNINPTGHKIILSANTDIQFNGGNLLGINSINITSINGSIDTPSQTNITEIGLLDYLNVNGAVHIYDEGLSALIVEGISTFNDKINGYNIQTTLLTVTGQSTLENVSSNILEVNADIDATSSTNGGTLIVTGGASISKSLYIGGNFNINNVSISSTELDYLNNITFGATSPLKLVGTSLSNNITGLNNISATTLTGTLQTSNQTNITSIGTLSNLNISGYLGIGTGNPIYPLEINSIDGNCLRLSYDKDTSNTNYANLTVSNGGVLTLDPSGKSINLSNSTDLSLFGNCKITAPQLLIGNTIKTLIPIEVGYTTYNMTGAYAYNNSANGHGTVASGSAFTYNYSIRTEGRILCTQSVDVASDRRLKSNINDLTDEFCTNFIQQTNPVSFILNRNNNDNHISYGYIAQDLLKQGFSDLVSLAPEPNLKGSIESDGFINPENIKFTVSYDFIIPILAKNQARLINENIELNKKIDKLLDLLYKLTNEKIN